MIFTLVSIIVPAAVFILLPRLLAWKLNKQPGSRWLLVAAGLLFFLSWYLPSPDIRGEDTAFLTHFVGGGLFTGFVWLYLVRALRLKLSWYAELAMLYFLVSGLGVANELFELAVVESGLATLGAADTWWDLLANSLGALTFWLGYRLSR